MGPNTKYSIELKERQHAWLEEMVKKYDLSDASKAIRCLINHANDNEELLDEIFEDIRCFDC